MKDECFNSAIEFLPVRIRNILEKIPDEIKNTVYEVRLRKNCAISLSSCNGIMFVKENGTTTFLYGNFLVKTDEEEIKRAFEGLCEYSVYSHKNEIAAGFITLKGGHRVGICGRGIYQGENLVNVRDISSLNVRIARDIKNSSDEIIRKVFNGKLKSVIISGPPCSGKTTILRDIAKQVANGNTGQYYKVAVVDERGEISPENCFENCPNTDILSFYKKSDGIMTALRCMSPDLIVCDEIGFSDECEKIKSGLNSGVNFAVSLHASDEKELFNKPQFKILSSYGEFKNIVLLESGSPPCRVKKIINTEEKNEDFCGIVNGDVPADGGAVRKFPVAEAM